MKTPEQLKGTIRNIASAKNLRSQEVLQMFFFERILERISLSKYQHCFILKGGLLISSLIGISERTTMDMDTTVTGIQLEEDEILRIIKEILSIDIGDQISFTIKKIEPIREKDDYNNFCVFLDAEYGKIRNPMRIDITTGDLIIPRSISYKYPLLFENRSINVMAYTIETIIAEKYETILQRNVFTTRARDFYDLYCMYHFFKDQIRIPVLQTAVNQTAKKRGTLKLLDEWSDIIEMIRSEKALHQLWEKLC